MFAALHQLKCLNKQCYGYVLNLTRSETLGQAGICRRNNKWSLVIRFYLHVNEFSLSLRWNRLQASVWKMLLLLGGKCLFCATALATLYCLLSSFTCIITCKGFMWFCWPLQTLLWSRVSWLNVFPTKILFVCEWVSNIFFSVLFKYTFLQFTYSAVTNAFFKVQIINVFSQWIHH